MQTKHFIMSQKIVEIINIKRSTAKLKHETSVYETLWLKNEGKLKSEGWLLKSDIESVEIIKVDDGLGLEEVEIVEAKEEEEEEEEEVLDVIVESKETNGNYEDYTLDELKEKLNAKGIKFHHASKEKKLIELLKAN